MPAAPILAAVAVTLNKKLIMTQTDVEPQKEGAFRGKISPHS
jgi:hypothetical protein